MSVDTTGRVPPHDLTSEAAVLSAVFIGGSDVFAELDGTLEPRDFYANSHARIFEAMRAEYVARGPIDIVTTLKRLNVTNRLGEIQGGAAYLTEIMNEAPRVANVLAYADAVRQLAVQRRLLRQLSEAMAKIYLGVTDVPKFLDDLERKVHDAAVDRVRTQGFESISSIGKRVVHEILVRRNEGRTMVGYPTGLLAIDRQMGGVHPGDLTIVAARPGMGKTALAMSIARSVAEHEENGTRPLAAVVFSLEMPKEQLAQRTLCSVARIDLKWIRNGDVSDYSLRRIEGAVHELESVGMYLDDEARTLDAIKSKCRRQQTDLAREGKRLGIIVIDYLQIMDLPDGERHDIRIGAVTMGCKSLAKELRVPVMLLSQLNRKCEDRQDKRPVTADLRDSGSIEQDADNILFIYRDEKYNAETAEPNVAEIIIDKQRNGPVGTVKVGFEKETVRFFDLEGA